MRAVARRTFPMFRRPRRIGQRCGVGGRSVVAAILMAAALSAVGCQADSDNALQYITDQRMQQGLVIVLPGIEGESEMNRDIRRGLDSAGVFRAIPIHRWGFPVPVAGMLVNQVDFIGNRLRSGDIAKMIVTYQDNHPGMPVYVVGHSGGGGMAVFAAEALPDGYQVDGLVLLSASISSAYDLTKALAHTKNGILNVYNHNDAGLLAVGTTVMGNVDGIHGPSAGLIGFDTDNRHYSRLYQFNVTQINSGDDPHFSTTRIPFVSTYVAPWVLAGAWPAGTCDPSVALKK